MHREPCEVFYIWLYTFSNSQQLSVTNSPCLLGTDLVWALEVPRPLSWETLWSQANWRATFPSTGDDTKTPGTAQPGRAWLTLRFGALAPVLVTSLEKWKCNRISKDALVHLLLMASQEVLRARKCILSRAGSMALTDPHHRLLTVFLIHALLLLRLIVAGYWLPKIMFTLWGGVAWRENRQTNCYGILFPTYFLLSPYGNLAVWKDVILSLYWMWRLTNGLLQRTAHTGFEVHRPVSKSQLHWLQLHHTTSLWTSSEDGNSNISLLLTLYV